MTFRQALVAEMVSRGMFESQANKVMEIVIADEVNRDMAGRWDEDASKYPAPLLIVLWLNARETALAWIDQNLPRAFYRPMFLE